ncbi:MAG: HAD-IG family 5'-nucleotidase [Deltaproteobacteria bacterium]|nr:HAD-IG family 5'-nucleotidase [Deltaproteobacteria bacterium]
MTQPVSGPVPAARGVFCNRTLNLRSIQVIGYDMDYTLVHYNVEAWEERAYEHCKGKLADLGWPVAGLAFDPSMVARGLVVDTERGNLLKANRFGFVKKAMHGTHTLGFGEQREAYARTVVDLAEPRWIFLNTLFSLSEGCLYAQLVDLLDAGKLPGPMGYRELYERVRDKLDRAHFEGQLKAEVLANPSQFVVADPETALTLLDQKHAGKKLLLITNSEWAYTHSMMSWSIGQFLPNQGDWRALFDVIVVGARKPDFFTGNAPLFEVATEDGLLRPNIRSIAPGRAYFGGSAVQLEKHLGVSGDDVLYVGDHMFGDVHVTKRVLHWRTALVLRELEDEIAAIEAFSSTEGQLEEAMLLKQDMETELSRARLALQRLRCGCGPRPAESEQEIEARVQHLREALAELDTTVAPMARASAELLNPRWGLLTRAGNDKSHLARQIERYADIYTSRVSNLLYATPYVYLRSPRGSLPHDPVVPGGLPTSGVG